jgi:hypothetical protein
MSNALATRVCAAGGAVYVVLGLIATSSNSNEPTLRSSRAEIARWAAEQHVTNGAVLRGFLGGIALIAVIPFAAALSRVLGAAERGNRVLSTTILASAAVWIAVKFASAMPEFALRWRASGMSPQLAATLHDMGDLAFTLTFIPQAVLLGCAAVVILRTRVLPRTIGWLGGITAVVLLVNVPIANQIPPVGALLALLWVLLTSVVLVRRGERAAVAVPATA